MADSVERLKSVIIEHVAKDVLVLSEQVDGLKESIDLIANLVKQIEGSTEGYFTNMQVSVIELIKEQEKHLREVAEKRTDQTVLNISDKVETILNDKFKIYSESVEKAMQEFSDLNKNALANLESEYNKTQQRIAAVGVEQQQANQGQSSNNKKMLIAGLAASSVLFGIAGLVIALLNG